MATTVGSKTRYVVDKDNTVHLRWCQQGQPYAGHEKTTEAEMLALITKGDSTNQFGTKNAGPSILTACSDCVVAEAEVDA